MTNKQHILQKFRVVIVSLNLFKKLNQNTNTLLYLYRLPFTSFLPSPILPLLVPQGILGKVQRRFAGNERHRVWDYWNASLKWTRIFGFTDTLQWIPNIPVQWCEGYFWYLTIRKIQQCPLNSKINWDQYCTLLK